MSDQDLRLVHMGRYPGRRVLTWHNGELYFSRNYSLWKGNPLEDRWEYVARYRPDWTRRLSSTTRLGGRLRRDGFHSLEILPSGAMVAVLPKAIAICPAGQNEFQVTWHINRGTRPLALTVSPDGAIYWGEYFNNPTRDEVHVYASTDEGRTWDVAYTFSSSFIRHVHSVTYDPYRDHLWMCTGDYGAECRIMRVSNDWQVIEPVLEGSQQVRTVRPIPAADGLYFTTDSELEQNYVYRLNSDDHLEQLHPINGPGMWSCQVGNALFFSSDIEPSKVNLDPLAAVYGSLNGTSWSRLVAWRKDLWHKRFFQYGNIVLPRGSNSSNVLAASGMAVQKEDDVMHVWRVE